MHRLSIERRHLLYLKSSACGQETAERVSKLIQKVNNDLKVTIAEVSNLLNKPIEFDDAKEPVSTLYQGIPSIIPGIPYRYHRQATDNFERKARANEELSALRVEIHSLYQYHLEMVTSLRQEIILMLA